MGTGRQEMSYVIAFIFGVVVGGFLMAYIGEK